MDTFLQHFFGHKARILKTACIPILLALFIWLKLSTILLGALFFVLLLMIEAILIYYYVTELHPQMPLVDKGDEVFLVLFSKKTLVSPKRRLAQKEELFVSHAREAEGRRHRKEQALQLQRDLQRERRLISLIQDAKRVADKPGAMVLLPEDMQWFCPMTDLHWAMSAMSDSGRDHFQAACQRAIESFSWYSRALVAGSSVGDLDRIQAEFIALVRNSQVHAARILVLETECRVDFLERAKVLGIELPPKATPGEIKVLVECAQAIQDRRDQILAWQQLINERAPGHRLSLFNLLTAAERAVEGSDRQWRMAIYPLEQALS